jgi:hypothetical protein
LGIHTNTIYFDFGGLCWLWHAPHELATVLIALLVPGASFFWAAASMALTFVK